MNFGRRKYQATGTDQHHLPHRLLLYKEPPLEELSLEEFEQFAVDRLKLLREVENINIRFKKGSHEYETKMRTVFKEFLPNYYHPKKERNNRYDEKANAKEWLAKELSDRRKDHISHFILRLAFARSEDLRRWFLIQEMDLFRYRFLLEEDEGRNDFLTSNNLQFKPISKEEKTQELENLKNAMFNAEMHTVTDTEFYKVPFTDVLDLVRSRKVYLHKGYAYVPYQELVSIIIGIYRSKLSHALTVTSRRLPYLEEDTRLLPMLKNLSSAYIGDSYTSKKALNDEKLSLNEIDEASKMSFPICMRHLNEGLRKDHHLKHFGRLQYGLFLKAAGLSLEEALIFWRTEFTKKMDVDKFEKGYAYNIRHNYGKEGKRADYTPYSCLKIITTNQPGPGDFHGCPFKHSDVDVLQRRLQMYKIHNEAINEIVDLVKRQHFQVACSRYFEVTHKLEEGTVNINHPNEYFDESRKVLKNGTKGSSMSGKTNEPLSPKQEKIASKQETPAIKQENMEMEFDLDDDIDTI